MIQDMFIATEVCPACNQRADQSFVIYSSRKGTEKDSSKKLRTYIKRTCQSCGKITEYKETQ